MRRDVMQSRWMCAAWLVLLVCVFATTATGGALRATWNPNPEPDLAGYILYYGTESGLYTNSMDVGNVTTTLVPSLADGQRYYFALSAYDLSGNESELSEPVSTIVIEQQPNPQVSEDGLTLGWSDIAEADAYEIYRDSSPYFSLQTPVAVLTHTTFQDNTHPDTPDWGTYYMVRAMAGDSAVMTFDRVGAFNIKLKRGRNLVSLPLVPGDGSLDSVIGDQLSGGSNASQSTKILVWDGTDYQVAWRLEGTSSELEGRWLTETGDQVSPITLAPDMSFWILTRDFHNDSLLTFSGAVAADTFQVIQLERGVNFIGHPYPVDIPLNETNLVENGVVTGGTSSASADKVLDFQNGSLEVAWLFAGDHPVYNGQWLNGSGSGISDMSLQPGRGYLLWIRNDNSSSEWQYPNPDPNF